MIAATDWKIRCQTDMGGRCKMHRVECLVIVVCGGLQVHEFPDISNCTDMYLNFKNPR